MSCCSGNGENILDKYEISDILTGKVGWIDSNLARKLARSCLDCIEKEFPHFVYSVSGDSFET
ncbi:MAG: hypothetical protein ACOC1V_07470, partial [Candidatus Saliniplasma sp.]